MFPLSASFVDNYIEKHSIYLQTFTSSFRYFMIDIYLSFKIYLKKRKRCFGSMIFKLATFTSPTWIPNYKLNHRLHRGSNVALNSATICCQAGCPLEITLIVLSPITKYNLESIILAFRHNGNSLSVFKKYFC